MGISQCFAFSRSSILDLRILYGKGEWVQRRSNFQDSCFSLSNTSCLIAVSKVCNVWLVECVHPCPPGLIHHSRSSLESSRKAAESSGGSSCSLPRYGVGSLERRRRLYLVVGKSSSAGQPSSSLEVAAGSAPRALRVP